MTPRAVQILAGVLLVGVAGGVMIHQHVSDIATLNEDCARMSAGINADEARLRAEVGNDSRYVVVTTYDLLTVESSRAMRYCVDSDHPIEFDGWHIERMQVSP